MRYKGTKNITNSAGIVKELTKFNKCNISDPYIDSAKHIRAMYRQQADYFAAYNEAVKNAHKNNAAQSLLTLKFAVQQTAGHLVRLCMYQLSDRRKKAIDRKGKIPAAAGLQINSNAPFVLSTNRKRIQKEMHCSSLGTVDNHLHRLEECGFITKHVFKGTRANIELHIHPYFLLISDHADNRWNPQEQPIPEPQLPQNLYLYYNTKENLNNIIIGGQIVENAQQKESGSQIFTNERPAARETTLKDALVKIFGGESERGLCPAKTKEIPENCRHCTDYGIMPVCKDCVNCETLKMSDLGSFWIDGKNISDRVSKAPRYPAGSRWGNIEKRKDTDPVFRRRFYTTLFISYAIENLFPRHNLYDSEQRRAFRIILERKDTYFKGCSSVEQYERELYRYFDRIKMAHNYSENRCFSMANIYPTAYFDPDSDCKCHFRNTEKWLKASDKYKYNREKARQYYKEHRLLGEMFASLRDNPSLDNFLFCEASMKRNIPQCENTLYMFYRALLYEYNVLLNPNKNENNNKGNISLPDGNAPP